MQVLANHKKITNPEHSKKLKKVNKPSLSDDYQQGIEDNRKKKEVKK